MWERERRREWETFAKFALIASFRSSSSLADGSDEGGTKGGEGRECAWGVIMRERERERERVYGGVCTSYVEGCEGGEVGVGRG